MTENEKLARTAKGIGEKLFVKVTFMTKKKTGRFFAVETACASKTEVMVRILQP